MDDDDENEVGYCRPPKRHQFQKGKSGNPAGRPRRPKPALLSSDSDIFQRLDGEIITVGSKTMTRREAESRVLFQLAVKGDSKARRLIENFRSARGVRLRGGVLSVPWKEFEKMRRVP